MMMHVTPRERLLSIGLMVVLAAWALYALAVKPARDRIRTLQRIAPEKQAQLRQLQTQSAQYTALRNELAQRQTKTASPGPDFQLLPFLESLVERHKLTKNVATMEPDTRQPQPGYAEAVTIELRDISLKQLIDFLNAVQTSETMVQVGSLYIRKNPHNEALLDSTVGISSPKLGPPALAAHTAS
jgi:type II secretory pathway component PulM